MYLQRNKVHEYLIELAKQNSEPITYGQLAFHFGQTISGDADVQVISTLLGEISESEDAQGKPMLTILVINKDTNMPGGGFFNLAHVLGKFNGTTDMERLAFYSSELKAVYDYWGTNS